MVRNRFTRPRRLGWALVTMAALAAVTPAAPVTAQGPQQTEEPSHWSPALGQIDDTAAALRGVAIITMLGGDEIHPVVSGWAMPCAPYGGGAGASAGGDGLEVFTPDIGDEVIVELRGFMDQTNALAELRQTLTAEGQRLGVLDELSGIIEGHISRVAEVMLVSEDARDLVERLGNSSLTLLPEDGAASQVWKAPAGVAAEVRDSHDRFSNLEILHLAWIQSEVASVLDGWARDQDGGQGAELESVLRTASGWSEVSARHRDVLGGVDALLGETVLGRSVEPVEGPGGRVDPNRSTIEEPFPSTTVAENSGRSTTTTSLPQRTTTTSEPRRTTTTEAQRTTTTSEPRRTTTTYPPQRTTTTVEPERTTTTTRR
ncbi:MAG: hypothetical protein ACLFRV_12895 [Acidimicrobiales bacterium]